MVVAARPVSRNARASQELRYQRARAAVAGSCRSSHSAAGSTPSAQPSRPVAASSSARSPVERAVEPRDRRPNRAARRHRRRPATARARRRRSRRERPRAPAGARPPSSASRTASPEARPPCIGSCSARPTAGSTSIACADAAEPERLAVGADQADLRPGRPRSIPRNTGAVRARHAAASEASIEHGLGGPRVGDEDVERGRPAARRGSARPCRVPPRRRSRARRAEASRASNAIVRARSDSPTNRPSIANGAMSTSPTAPPARISAIASRPTAASLHAGPPIPNSATSSRPQQVDDARTPGVGTQRVANRGLVEQPGRVQGMDGRTERIADAPERLAPAPAARTRRTAERRSRRRSGRPARARRRRPTPRSPSPTPTTMPSRIALRSTSPASRPDAPARQLGRPVDASARDGRREARTGRAGHRPPPNATSRRIDDPDLDDALRPSLLQQPRDLGPRHADERRDRLLGLTELVVQPAHANQRREVAHRAVRARRGQFNPRRTPGAARLFRTDVHRRRMDRHAIAGCASTALGAWSGRSGRRRAGASSATVRRGRAPRSPRS